MDVHEGKWGFYPCSYELFKKLKEINKVITLSIHQRGAWLRWARKASHNRLSKEPIVCSIFFEKTESLQLRDLGGNFYKEKVKVYNYNLNELGKYVKSLILDYKNARKPVERENVKALMVSEEVIEQIYQKIMK